MLLWEYKSRVLWCPKISLLRLDDEESSLEWGSVFEVDEDLKDRMNTDKAILESEVKISSSFLSMRFDVVTTMSFIWRQDKNAEDTDEHDEYKEWDK